MGSIVVVGIGPGGREHLTGRAFEVLAEAEVVVGYNFYLELVADLIVGKETVATGMTREIDRCRAAIEMALAGKRVAVVSTGDPGVYGMAGLVLELLEEMDRNREVSVEIVPGVGAAGAAASVLGAPLMSDYAVISLSDLLTPWGTIEKRLEAAGLGDFVVAIYNPRSKKRTDHLDRAAGILLRHRPASTPVGIVRNALREGQSATFTTLGEVANSEVDMMSMVIVGNSATRMTGGRMITPRGYESKQR